MRQYLGILFVVVILLVPWMAYNYPAETQSFISSIGDIGSQLAAVIITHNPKTIAQLQSRYSGVAPVASFAQPKKVRVLIVPGHEPDYGGAEYGSLKERNMTVELAGDLQQFLSNNSRYEVIVTRDTKSWSPTFTNYFKTGWNDIIEWQKAHKDEIVNLERLGQYHPVAPKVEHQNVPNDVAYRIYGIDKWVDENDIDIVIHVHFNDYPGHGTVPGDYSGIAIYVPQKQYDNSKTTQVIADSIFKRLSKYNPISNLAGESGGIVQDQDLIAVGAYNSVDAASMLIEYGYIYEPQFTDATLHDSAIKDLAFQTYLGLQDFFDPRNAVNQTSSVDTLVMPHQWTNSITANNAKVSDIFALQTALVIDGDYPPNNKSMNDCPRNGSLGPCTKAALQSFQDKFGITSEKGMVGPKTIDALNRVFGIKNI